ncbi:GntR family transcriptional regulator [Acuticoccus yangtzensis]|uniref:GntR family transcriptional regulator n=1 Tax=Acuticoccus yangtzensis TaxID=1443441 RepID=UPI0009F81EE6|nr:GntR family transcriptional regulator [Acuticoccus yangtzensis]
MSVEETRPRAPQGGRRPGDVKLYAIVCDRLRRQIRSGQRTSGDRLPSLEALAQEFGVSLITVRHAVSMLEAEGLLERQHGRGTFVAHGPNARQWLALSTTWSDLIAGYEKQRGLLANEVLILRHGQRLPLSPDEAARSVADSYVFMRRLHRVEGLPYAYTDLYLDAEVFARDPAGFQSEMVLAVLSRLLGPSLGGAFQTLTIGAADTIIADLLGLAVGSPIGELLRTVVSDDGRLLYRGQVIYRGDLVRVDTRLL